jgi:AraC-like DNA-binding protein
MLGATVATTSSRALLAACARLGIDAAELLAAAGLEEERVNDPDERLPGEAVATLWRTALARSGDPGLGLHAALAVPFGAYRVIDFLAASAPTVGEGLERVARYFPLINSALSWEVIDGGASIRLALAAAQGGLPRPYAEYAVAVTILHCRRASGFDWPLVEVTFEFAAPESGEEHERAFGCPVRFGEPQNSFVLARATWDLPSQAASSELLRTLEEHADRMIARLRREGAISAQVAQLIVEELRGGDPTLQRVARRLAVSPRTLQRRLEGEGTSFADLLDRTRRHFAETYVKERNIALSEVAHLLGFSEQSAFTRAFQRWYGVPPKQFRARESAA